MMPRKKLCRYISKVIETVLDRNCNQSIKFLTPKLRIKATKIWHTNVVVDIRLTIGEPNSKEKRFIRKCEQVKEPFPVKKIQTRREK